MDILAFDKDFEPRKFGAAYEQGHDVSPSLARDSGGVLIRNLRESIPEEMERNPHQDHESYQFLFDDRRIPREVIRLCLLVFISDASMAEIEHARMRLISQGKTRASMVWYRNPPSFRGTNWLGPEAQTSRHTPPESPGMLLAVLCREDESKGPRWTVQTLGEPIYGRNSLEGIVQGNYEIIQHVRACRLLPGDKVEYTSKRHP